MGKVLQNFQDAFKPQSYIGFYGGEPLLEFDTIRRTVEYIQAHKTLRRKKLRYSISTNGILLTEEIRSFLASHKFRVNLSHDGTAQEITRPSRMNPLILENIERMIRLKGLEFETNSVFIPSTAGEIFRSARFLLEMGVQTCNLSYSITDRWDSYSLGQVREQLQELTRFLLCDYRWQSPIPVVNFRSQEEIGIFWCAAGQDRLALGVDGKLWGCRFFADFFADKPEHPEFNNYCFGDFREGEGFPQDAYSAVCRNYGHLRQEAFSSEQKACRDCLRLLYCSVCPASAAFGTGTIGKVPTWMCEMKKIWREEINTYWEAVGFS